MFTGIVAAVGAIRQVEPLAGGSGVRLDVEAGQLDMVDVALGDSIAIQGACMTVIGKTADGFTVDVSAESLKRTVGLSAPGPVNLEKAMRLSDRVGGHLVSGHVDGQGVVRRFEPVGESHLLEILAPATMAGFLVYKGSITVDGVSLTVNHVEDPQVADMVDPQWPAASQTVLDGVPTCCAFQINLIPHTVVHTTLQRLRPGDRVNLEIDTVARYLARMRDVEARTGIKPGAGLAAG